MALARTRTRTRTLTLTRTLQVMAREERLMASLGKAVEGFAVTEGRLATAYATTKALEAHVGYLAATVMYCAGNVLRRAGRSGEPTAPVRPKTAGVPPKKTKTGGVGGGGAKGGKDGSKERPAAVFPMDAQLLSYRMPRLPKEREMGLDAKMAQDDGSPIADHLGHLLSANVEYRYHTPPARHHHLLWNALTHPSHSSHSLATPIPPSHSSR